MEELLDILEQTLNFMENIMYSPLLSSRKHMKKFLGLKRK